MIDEAILAGYRVVHRAVFSTFHVIFLAGQPAVICEATHSRSAPKLKDVNDSLDAMYVDTIRREINNRLHSIFKPLPFILALVAVLIGLS